MLEINWNLKPFMFWEITSRSRRAHSLCLKFTAHNIFSEFSMLFDLWHLAWRVKKSLTQRGSLLSCFHSACVADFTYFRSFSSQPRYACMRETFERKLLRCHLVELLLFSFFSRRFWSKHKFLGSKIIYEPNLQNLVIGKCQEFMKMCTSQVSTSNHLGLIT